MEFFQLLACPCHDYQYVSLVYNGFVSNNVLNDSIIRLVLIGVYAIANFRY